MPFRQSILNISPPFLVEEGGVGEAVQYSEGTLLDALGDWAAEGVKAAMPGIGTPQALYLIGRDMQIDRGPTETDEHYAERLAGAVDSHRVKGSGPELLRQLALGWFSPSTDTPVRLVSNSAVWHEINYSTGAVTKTDVGTNWEWDAYASSRPKRGWVIIDVSTSMRWEPEDVWGVGDWGEEGTWGSTATLAEVSQIRRIIDQWKPAHMTVINIIITFDGSFLRTDTSPPNPDGDSDTAAWKLAQDAAFWGPT